MLAMQRSAWSLAAIMAASVAACSTHRAEQVPTYRDDLAVVVVQRCTPCHAEPAPAGGFRASSYLDVIGCTADGTPAARSDNAPILRALASPSHSGVADTRELFERWIRAGAPAFTGGVHPASFIDPRSPESHGKFLRARQWKPMLDASDRDACGVCHEGAPARPSKVSEPAPGATACTNCHSAENGPLSCSTCHGGIGGSAYPPRDSCFFPSKGPDSHAAHVQPSAAKQSGLDCASCHPTPTTGAPSGTHGDGHVEVWLGSGSFDATSRACATRCHSGPGAARPAPTWGEATKMVCTDCHGTPPPAHAKGACSNCHREANAAGTALLATNLHLNLQVNPGDGSGRCGSCHGNGDDPWPSTGAHAKHKTPGSAAPVACSTCHDVPQPGDRHPRGDGAAIVRLSGLATKGGRAPTWDAATKTCTNTYCHYGPGATLPAPTWTSGPSASTCGACHAAPPPPPHTTSSSCGLVGCHNGAVSGGALTPGGSAVHVDGRIQL